MDSNGQVTPHPFQSSKNIVGAILLIFLGLILLAMNLGLYPKAAIPELIRFWPLLLVLLGLQFIIGHNTFGKILIFIISVITLSFVTYLTFNRQISSPNSSSLFQWFENLPLPNFGHPQNTAITINDPGPSVTQKTVNLKVGAATALITDQNIPQLVTINSQSASIFKPSINQKISPVSAKVNIDLTGGLGLFNPSQTDYQVILGKTNLPTTLTTEVGAGQVDLELSTTRLDQLNLKVGAGTLNVYIDVDAIPRIGLKATLSAGKLHLILPSSVGLKVRYDTTLGKVTINGIPFEGKGEYQSLNYSTSRTQLDLNAAISTGALIIENGHSL